MSELGSPSAPQLESLTRGGKISSVTAGRRGTGLARGILPPLIAFGCFIGIAYLFSYVLLSPGRRFLMPPPHDVVAHSFFRSKNLHEQLGALWDTAQVSISGLEFSAFSVGYA